MGGQACLSPLIWAFFCNLSMAIVFVFIGPLVVPSSLPFLLFLFYFILFFIIIFLWNFCKPKEFCCKNSFFLLYFWDWISIYIAVYSLTSCLWKEINYLPITIGIYICRGCAASRRKFHFLESRKCVWYLSGKYGETRKYSCHILVYLLFM